MKKLILLLSLTFFSLAINAQYSIPNGNFEQWTTNTFDNPLNYPNTSNVQNFFRYHLPGNVTKTQDAYHGLYAVQLTTNANATDTSFAYFVNESPEGDPSTWTGGMPYNQKPTGIRGYYKYNVANADSGTIFVTFSKAGVNVGSYFFLVGGIQNNYTLFDFTLNPALSVTPDSVIFGALSCKFVGGEPHGPVGSTLILDNVSFTGVNSQPTSMNGDFEEWQTQTYNSPNNWYTRSDMGEGFNRITDAVAGNYAIELITTLGTDQYGNPKVRQGHISTGYYPDNCNPCNQLGGYPYSNQIDTLAFWYKYAPSNNDSAQVYLSFKKNGIQFSGAIKTLHAASSYTYMEIPFYNWQTPDSVVVEIQSSVWQDSLPSFAGSSLIIDEMHFKSQPFFTGINSVNFAKNNVHIYPNPVKTIATININPDINTEGLELRVYDIYGRTIKKTNIENHTFIFDGENLSSGLYFYEVGNSSRILQNGKLVME